MSAEYVRNAHATPAEAVLERSGVPPAEGLAPAEAARRLVSHGPNVIEVRRKAPVLRILLHQFASPVVYLLSAATVLAASFGEWKEAGAILVVLVINTAIGFTTEIRAARSIEALRSLGAPTARVRRGGQTMIVPAETLVPGDVLLVEAGDRIAADVRLVEASSLAANESALTGESVATEKSIAAVHDEAPLGERSCMLYKGTAVTRGSGAGVVVGTGLSTELGHISKLVLEAEAGRSPLERRLASLSVQLVWIVLLLAILIAVAGVASGKEPLLMVEAAIALSVAAIPEGLPIVATLALARGMWRMARRNALVERLSAVETLGATTLILTDKTGTLTENRMTVRRLVLPSGDLPLERGGLAESKLHAVSKALQQEAGQLLQKAVLCNDSTLAKEAKESSGDPMELALLRVGNAMGVSRDRLIATHAQLAKRPFDSDLRMMATLHADAGSAFWAVKGAPEAVFAKASKVATANGTMELTEPLRAKWRQKVDRLGRDGLRVLAFAFRDADPGDDGAFRDLVLLGLIGLEDPPRADVPGAIADCKNAGIRVVMVTGDHAVTARSIGLAVGLHHAEGCVVEGGDPERLRKSHVLASVTIFARVSPAEKLALVQAYQEAGEVVAMTGDGINDAPALKQADIGVAMGQRGTDVARQAAAMILLDDAFPTIVRAIREGRVIFDNIRRFVTYLLSCNLSEVLVVGLAVLVTLPLPILPLQILYLNLVTDVFPAFALAMSEGERDVLRRPPRPPSEAILMRRHWFRIVLHGCLLAATTFAALAFARFELDLDVDSTVTMTFLTLAFGQLWHVFNMRGRHSRVVSNEITLSPWIWVALALCFALLVVPIYVPALAEVLGLVRPNRTMWTVIIALSLLPPILGQVVQWLADRSRPDPQETNGDLESLSEAG